MSTPEETGQLEQKSSIKIGSNSKGDPQVEVKAYTGASIEEMDALRAVAVAAYKQTRQDVGFPVGQAAA